MSKSDYVCEGFLRRDFPEFFRTFTKQLLHLSLSLLSSSPHLDDKQGELEIARRMAASWESDFVQPLFQDFTSAFAEQVQALLTVPEFDELSLQQRKRDA